MTCNLELGDRCVLNKKMKAKFGTATHHSEGLFGCVHVDVWGLAKTASLGDHQYFIFFIDGLSRHYTL